MLDKKMRLGGIECFDSIKRGRQIPVDSSLVTEPYKPYNDTGAQH